MNAPQCYIIQSLPVLLIIHFYLKCYIKVQSLIFNHIRNPAGAFTFSIEHLDSGPDGWKHVADTIQTDGLANLCLYSGFSFSSS